MVLEVRVQDDADFIRGMNVKQDEDRLYLSFYSTFGGKSKLGAEHRFLVKLPEGCSAVYFDRPETREFEKKYNKYAKVLQYDRDLKEWVRAE